jgi:hypothetical protein
MLPQPENLFERVLLWMAQNVPGRILALLAAISYGGLGLATPIALDASAPLFVVFNLYGTLIAFLIVLVWVMADRRT